MGISRGWVAVREIDGQPTAEEELVRAGQSGDRAALDQLLALHERPLAALCHGILAHAEDAEDAAQETFLRALRALPRFRCDASFRTWLFRIALNVCLTRKQSRRVTEPLDTEDATPIADADCPEAIALRRLRITEALSGLRPRHRAVFLLKVQQGWSVAEIAVVLQCSPIRVQNDLAKARRILAEWRQANGTEGGAL